MIELKRRFIFSDRAEFGAKVIHRTQAASKFCEFLYLQKWKSSIRVARRMILRFNNQQNRIHSENHEQAQYKMHSVRSAHQNEVRGDEGKA